jgi:hypothetical protein
MASQAGINLAEVFARVGLPAFFAWHLLSDNKLADVSAALRIAAGFY